MTYLKYIFLSAFICVFVACNDPEDVDLSEKVVVTITPDLVSGSANFSNYVALGNSLTSGFTDGSLFKAAQQNSFPNILASKFSLTGGGDFIQPLTNDNIGGLAAAGIRILEPRLIFGGQGPVTLESVEGSVNVTTDILINNPSGPFNNLGVPGAKSFDLVASGYGNFTNIPLGAANPFFIRMTGATPDASVIALAEAQEPTFFSLWIGNNDVLSYATSGGDGTGLITEVAVFENSYDELISKLTVNDAGGVVANIPNITSIPHFTTVPHNPLDPTSETFGSLIPTLNGIFSQINDVYTFLEAIDPTISASQRSILFSTTAASAVVIKDETLRDISSQITAVLNASPDFPALVGSFGLPEQNAPLVASLLGNAYGQTRQATEDDLLVLPSAAIIGKPNTEYFTSLVSQGLPQGLAGQFSVEGVTYALDDKWVLLPNEQQEIKNATIAFNTFIMAKANDANLAFVDANLLLNKIATTGITSDNFTLKSNLVTGGAFSLDGIHPTARGYALLANEFLKAIDATYGSNFELSGNLAAIGTYPTNYSSKLR